MAVPKRKHSKARTRKRRAHDAVPRVSLASCQRCGQTIRPHTICGNCGNYRGEHLINLEDTAS